MSNVRRGFSATLGERLLDKRPADRIRANEGAIVNTPTMSEVQNVPRMTYDDLARHCKSVEGKLARQLTHGESMNRERNEARELVRIAMQTLLALYLDVPEAREAVDAIAAKSPWAMEEGFVKGESICKK